MPDRSRVEVGRDRPRVNAVRSSVKRSPVVSQQLDNVIRSGALDIPERLVTARTQSLGRARPDTWKRLNGFRGEEIGLRARLDVAHARRRPLMHTPSLDVI